MPGVALELSPGDFLGALEGISESQNDALRLAVFPIWFEKGKKGTSFVTFLSQIGLGENKTSQIKRGAKPTKEQIAAIYAKGAEIAEKHRNKK